MALLKIKLTNGAEVEFLDSPIGSGAEKVVFFTKDKKEVVCFYKNLPDIVRDRHGRRSRLDNILAKHNCTTGANGDYWKTHYCWPTGIMDGDRNIPTAFLSQHGLLNPPLAIVTASYPAEFFFKDRGGRTLEKNGKWFTSEKPRSRLPPEEKGNFLNYVRVCVKMARAVRKLHMTGLAHSDLSNKNVLIDPRNGSALVIDIDALVVPGIAPPTVLGTPGYIAPEVVAGKGMPCIETDRHALAVLIYETLLLRHPLRGPKVHHADPDQDDLLLFGARALFIEHPTDKSNAIKPPPAVPLSRLGPYLVELFNLAFIDGLHTKSKRPGVDRWERALYHTLDLLHPSPSGGEWFVLAPGMPMHCPFTGKRLSQPVPFARLYLERKAGHFVDDHRTLTISHGLSLMKWHTVAGCSPGENADPTPQGYFQLHQGRWWLTNQSGVSLQVINGAQVANGQPIEITKGLKIRFPAPPASSGQPSPTSRLLEFDFMQP